METRAVQSRILVGGHARVVVAFWEVEVVATFMLVVVFSHCQVCRVLRSVVIVDKESKRRRGMREWKLKYTKVP